MIFTIRGKIPTLNEYIKAERTNRYLAAKLKQETQDALGWQVLNGRPPTPPETPQDLAVAFVLKDLRKDYDNVAFGLKFIQDALVEYGWLRDDSPKYLNPPRVFFAVDKADPRTVIRLTVAEPYAPSREAVELLTAAEYLDRFT